MIVTVENRACSAAAAVGSCADGTTERSAPTSAMLKNTYIDPSRNATIAIWMNVIQPNATATTMVVSSDARTTSDVIIIALRGNRSAATPATNPKSAHGRMRAKPTTPAFAGECVSARMSSG